MRNKAMMGALLMVPEMLIGNSLMQTGPTPINPADIDVSGSSPNVVKLHPFTIHDKTILAPDKKAAKKIYNRENNRK